MTILDYLKSMYMPGGMPPPDASLYADQTPMPPAPSPYSAPSPMAPTTFQAPQMPSMPGALTSSALPSTTPLQPVGGPQQKKGLLDFLREPGMSPALLSAAAQFFQAGGYSDKPISTGQALGAAINAGTNTFQGYQDRAFDKAYKTAALSAKGDSGDHWRDLTPEEVKKYFPQGLLSGYGAQVNTKDGQIRTFGVDPYRVTQSTGADGLPVNVVTDLRNPNGQGGSLRPAPPGYRYLDPKDPSKGVTPVKGGSADILTPQQAGQVSMMQAAQTDVAKASQMLVGPDGKVNRTLLAQSNISVPFLGGGLPGTPGRDVNSYIRNTLSTILRLETGAAATPSEVDEVAKRYQPSLADSDATIREKLARLQERLQNSITKVDPTGRFGDAAPAQGAPQSGGLTYDPATGTFH